MAEMQLMYDVFEQLRKVIELPELCREVTIHLSLHEAPTVTAVYFPDKSKVAETPVTQRFRLHPMKDDEV